MLLLGQYNYLTILRKTSVGFYLGDDEGNDVLLPNKYILPEYEIGSKIRVFVYKDYEQRWIATNLTPFAEAGQFAFLEVRSVSEHGAFLIWGLEKDLFVPFREQKQKMESGRSYVVYVTIDEETQRMMATTKIHRHLKNSDLKFEPGDAVNLLIFETTPLGYNAIINQKHKGLIYHNEIFRPIHIGDKFRGYIKQIRENDQIDLSLQPIGMQRLEDGAEQIVQALEKQKGFIPLTDNSSPEDIQQQLKMSKKNFKKSVGILFKQKRILLENNGIRLVKS
ncbi:MAG: RNA-binding protein [Chitinophagaceae bacterium]|nr:RNA-binding protein [Chitinophagaceae bacterium]